MMKAPEKSEEPQKKEVARASIVARTCLFHALQVAVKQMHS